MKQVKSISLTKEQNNISVIIPFRNEEKHLLNCLESLQNQNFNKASYELILVDDHSSDESVKIAEEFIDKSDLSIRLIALEQKTSKKEALKKGISLAKYGVIATTDADCVLPENWLIKISNNFTSDSDMFLGPIMFKKGNGFLSAFQTLDMLAIQGVEFGALGFNQPILNNAANLSYTIEAYNSVNGLDDLETPSGDDIFLLEKFKRKNLKIKGELNNELIVETQPETSLLSFLNQRIRWSSKAKHYSDKLLLFFSGLVLIQNVSLLLIYVGLLFVENHITTYTFLLLTKWLIDFILLFLVASFFRRKSVMFYFIPVQILYPFYVIMVWIASVFIKFEWKGRKY